MTPFYIVVEAGKADQMVVRSICFHKQIEALALAKEITKRTGTPTWVVEAIASVVIPKPEPIVTMKGD
jgi:hypothetical protein